jgi:3-dehydroquinate dehydratase-1
LSARDERELLEQAERALADSPDLVEWRADGFSDVDTLSDTCAGLKRRLGEIPLLFTLRHYDEGGARRIPQEKRLHVILEMIASGRIELVDIELINGPEFIAAVREAAERHGVKLILSYHNFTHTPPPEQMYAKLLEAAKNGADIAKLAVMPRNNQDVLNLLQVTDTARNGLLDIPLITASMGPLGMISRMAGGQFGSAVIFAASAAKTAPGQLPAALLKKIVNIIAEG